ncbi:9756_t:CDS:10, partial [Racocetra fulgida]
IVAKYLDAHDCNVINTVDLIFEDEEQQPLSESRCRQLLQKYFFDECSQDIVSYRFLETFINVLANQLSQMSSSVFFRVDTLKWIDADKNLRKTLLETFIKVSKDFATRSVDSKVAQLKNLTNLEDIAISNNIRPWEDSNHLLVFFLSQSTGSICALYRDKYKVPRNVENLLRSQHHSRSFRNRFILDDYNKMSSESILMKLESMACVTSEKRDYPLYALSTDNLLKMALVLLRSRANIPVVVCGEAGCGKTSLIQFLSIAVGVELLILNVHAGISVREIVGFVSEAEKIAVKPDTQAGLSKRYEEKSRLVYQVRPLPDQILDFVWDYGVLKPSDEKIYIDTMVKKFLEDSHMDVKTDLFVELLFESQEFIRDREGIHSVSLRDVKRAIIIFKFFSQSLKKRQELAGPEKNQSILGSIWKNFQKIAKNNAFYGNESLGNIEIRDQYQTRMCGVFGRFGISLSHQTFVEIIQEEQMDFMKRMTKPNMIAENFALLENVLVMTVCILTRIPLFIIGAPGASKSLAIRIVSQSLRGADSEDPYFRTLPQMSPHNPLKVLHSILEPNYPAELPEFLNHVIIEFQKIDLKHFVMIRPEFKKKDLIDTAKRILGVKADQTKFDALANSYLVYEKSQPLANFHGLRDYYSLVKSLGKEKYMKYSVEELIRANLGDKNARHLMVIGKSNSIVNLLTYKLRKWNEELEDKDSKFDTNLEPVVIYGSQFPDDFDGDYQYILDEKKVDFSDPPLLNRFEKQNLSINDVMDINMKRLFKELEKWSNQIGVIAASEFTEKDIFVGFDNEETLQMAQFLFATEKVSGLSIFGNNATFGTFSFWKSAFMDTKILNIDKLIEPRPDAYHVPKKIDGLRLPFSTCFIEWINKFKNLYQDNVNALEENIDDETDELHIENEEDINGSDNENTKEYNEIVEIKDINRSENEILRFWQREVAKILSLSCKLETSFENPSLQKLRVYNDLSKSFSLTQLLEIRHLDMNTDEDNIFSEQFINLVFDKFDKIENTEIALLSRRSFIYRCLDIIPFESSIRSHFYKKIFSQEPLPLTFYTIYLIFEAENREQEELLFFKLIDNFDALNSTKQLQDIENTLSERKNSAMAALCCDVIQTQFFMKYKFEELFKYFLKAINILIASNAKALQLVTAIALLKTIANDLWNHTRSIKPILEFTFEDDENENNIIETLNQRLLIDEIKQFCNMHQQLLPWAKNLEWDDYNRLGFNPYWYLEQFKHINISFRKMLQSDESYSETIFNSFIENDDIAQKISFAGMVISNFYIVRASRNLNQAENILKQKIFSCLESSQLQQLQQNYKTYLINFMSNCDQLYKLNPNVENTEMFIASVVAHIVALHISIPANASPLAAYMQELHNYNDTYILTYGKCPQCKSKVGAKAYHKLADESIYIDNDKIKQKIVVNDKKGYIAEEKCIDNNYYSVRTMHPAAYRILHLFLHSIIGLQANSPAATAFIGSQDNDIILYCKRNIENDWKVLKNIFACDDETLALAIHAILSEMSQEPQQNIEKFTTSIQREAWEEQFNQQYVLPRIRNFRGTANDFRMKIANSQLK